MLSAAERSVVQALIESGTEEERAALRRDAEAALKRARRPGDDEIDPEAIDFAIEVLTRLDAETCGGGWWYRRKRRPELLRHYLGS